MWCATIVFVCTLPFFSPVSFPFCFRNVLISLCLVLTCFCHSPIEAPVNQLNSVPISTINYNLCYTYFYSRRLSDGVCCIQSSLYKVLCCLVSMHCPISTTKNSWKKSVGHVTLQLAASPYKFQIEMKLYKHNCLTPFVLEYFPKYFNHCTMAGLTVEQCFMH